MTRDVSHGCIEMLLGAVKQALAIERHGLVEFNSAVR